MSGFGGVKVGTPTLPALSEDRTVELKGWEKEEVETAEQRGIVGVQMDIREERLCQTERRKREREREGGAQYFLNSTSSGGVISTFLLPTSFQLVLRTVPPDSICRGKTPR